MFSDTKIKLDHRLRFASQMIRKPRLAVAGSYYGGNCGDMSLGRVVQEHAQELNYRSGLQTLSNLRVWPRSEAILLGGGAIGLREPMETVASLYDPSKVAISGVDFHEETFTPEIIKFLKKIRHITCRFEQQRNILTEILQRDDIERHWDLCFALPTPPSVKRVNETPTKIGINLLPMQMHNANGRFEPNPYYRGGTNGNEKQGIKIAENYAEYFRWICIREIENKNHVVHLPFTLEDNLYAREVLKGLPVEFHTYTGNYNAVFRKMSDMKRFYSSRFHSAIFSMILKKPLLPMCYSYKCKWLLDDAGAGSENCIYPEDLLDNWKKKADTDFDGFTMSDIQHRNTKKTIHQSLQKIIRGLLE